jgi:hypothetical protein
MIRKIPAMKTWGWGYAEMNKTGQHDRSQEGRCNKMLTDTAPTFNPSAAEFNAWCDMQETGTEMRAG